MTPTTLWQTSSTTLPPTRPLRLRPRRGNQSRSTSGALACPPLVVVVAVVVVSASVDIFCGVVAVGAPSCQHLAQVVAPTTQRLCQQALQRGTRSELRAPPQRRHLHRTAHLAVKREDEYLVVVTIVVACAA